MLVVKDMNQSQQLYKEVFGLGTMVDFGANVTLTGGLTMQTQESCHK